MLTQARLEELLHYDPETGLFTRLVRTSNSTKVGDVVGTAGKGGYLACSIDWKFHQMHRLAFLYMTGSFPVYDVDHINGLTADNRWCNLRDVPTQLNVQNVKRANKNNRSGFMGVHWREERAKWVASIRINGKYVRLGSFDTPEEAHAAYLEGKRKHHEGFLL